MKNIIKRATLCLILGLTGCATTHNSLPEFQHRIVEGQYLDAQKIADDQFNHSNQAHHLLWLLQSATSARLLKDYKTSNKLFDQAEQYFNAYDQQMKWRRTTQNYSGLLLNDAILPYTGKIQDRIMLNTYKALNFAALGDMENARVEFNRALQRQNEAKLFFFRQTKDIKKQLASQKNSLEDDEQQISDILKNPKIDRLINNRYKNLKEFTRNKNYVNPFTTYMAGLFFWLENDHAKAVDILKEAYAMTNRNENVQSDLHRATRKERPHNEAWIIFENGLAPQLEEMRINLPIKFNPESNFTITTALPNLKVGRAATSFISILADNKASVQTTSFANMDQIIFSEFKKALPTIITREVFRTAIKAYIQYEMNRQYGSLAGLASGLYHVISTSADLRSWSSLAHDFQLAHIPIPENKTVTIVTTELNQTRIKIPTGADNVIIYIRIVAEGVDPVIDFIEF